MDFEKELLADFGSDSDSDNEPVQVPQLERVPEKGPEQDLEPAKIQNTLDTPIETLLQQVLYTKKHHPDSSPSSLSLVKPLIPQLQQKLDQYSGSENTDFLDLLASVQPNLHLDEYNFVLQANDLSAAIHEEIAAIHSYIKHHYMPVFPELETLVLNPADYAKAVLIIKTDLVNVKLHEQDLKAVVSQEKLLVIIMSALHQSKTQEEVREDDLNNIVESCFLLLELHEFDARLSDFLSLKLSKLAPNVAAIVGPKTASQLLIATGSLQKLSLTPACNLPSLGVRDLSSKARTSVRSSGYIYHCDVINFLPQDVIKQAMRIVSAKVVLAARIDLSRSSPNGDLGAKYLDEIKTKIDKLLTPPEAVKDKALPAPVEQKSKKRGGRRFRKMKERFQMSDLRKAQNKMEFGKQEETVLDGFGQEIGLGMSKSNGRLTIQSNSSTNAKMSKAMIARLQERKQQRTDDQLDAFTIGGETNGKTPVSKSKWITGLKRHIDGDSDQTSVKRQKGE